MAGPDRRLCGRGAVPAVRLVDHPRCTFGPQAGQQMSNRDASLFLILGIIGVDASTKEAALMYLDGSVVPVLPVLNLTLGFNTGVSFGMFASDGTQGWWAIVLLTLAI